VVSAVAVDEVRRLLEAHGFRVLTLAEVLAGAHPKLARGRVWCRHCGHSERVDAARALRESGWPRHCGQTMTIDAPEERR
jgi:hypothetical protein